MTIIHPRHPRRRAATFPHTHRRGELLMIASALDTLASISSRRAGVNRGANS